MLKIAHYNGNRKFTLDHYSNLVAKTFFQLEESCPVYTFTEAQNTNSFENGHKKPTDIKPPITKKRE